MLNNFSRSGIGGRRPQQPITFFSILILVIVFVVVFFFRDGVAGLLWRGMLPLLVPQSLEDSSENQRLRDALSSTTSALADRTILYQENVDLKARLWRNVGVQAILAGVVSRPPRTPYDTLVIDVGSAQGLVVGDLVSAGGTAFIGTVSQVYSTTARVELFSAPGETHDGLLSTSIDNSVPIILEGQGAGSLMARVPVGVAVAVGDAVVLPGVATGLFGAVSHIEMKTGESFKTIFVHLPVNLFSIRYVEVLKTIYENNI